MLQKQGSQGAVYGECVITSYSIHYTKLYDDAAADYVFTGHQLLNFDLPGPLRVIVFPQTWEQADDKTRYFPIYQDSGYTRSDNKGSDLNFVMVDCFNQGSGISVYLEKLINDPSVVLCLSSTNKNAMQSVRLMFIELMRRNIKNPVIHICDSNWRTPDENLIHFASETGGLLIDGFGDGISLGLTAESYSLLRSGRVV